MVKGQCCSVIVLRDFQSHALMLMDAFSSKEGLKFSRGNPKKFRNRAAAVTGPQREQRRSGIRPHLDLVTLHFIIAHATLQINYFNHCFVTKLFKYLIVHSTWKLF